MKADGQDDSVTGHPYYDSASITIVDDHTITEVDKKNGKTVTTSKFSVSPDVYARPGGHADLYLLSQK